MAFLFNRARSRQPLEVVRSTKDLLLKLHETPNTPKVGPCADIRASIWLELKDC